MSTTADSAMSASPNQPRGAEAEDVAEAAAEELDEDTKDETRSREERLRGPQALKAPPRK